MKTLPLEKFVESILSGVVTNQGEKSVELLIHDTDGVFWRFRMEGVRDCLISEMRLQNIIDHIQVLSSSSDDLEFRRYIYFVHFGKMPDDDSDLHSSIVNDGIRDAQNEGYSLVVVEPVYGAFIAALTQSISVDTH